MHLQCVSIRTSHAASVREPPVASVHPTGEHSPRPRWSVCPGWQSLFVRGGWAVQGREAALRAAHLFPREYVLPLSPPPQLAVCPADLMDIRLGSFLYHCLGQCPHTGWHSPQKCACVWRPEIWAESCGTESRRQQGCSPREGASREEPVSLPLELGVATA